MIGLTFRRSKPGKWGSTWRLLVGVLCAADWRVVTILVGSIAPTSKVSRWSPIFPGFDLERSSTSLIRATSVCRPLNFLQVLDVFNLPGVPGFSSSISLYPMMALTVFAARGSCLREMCSWRGWLLGRVLCVQQFFLCLLAVKDFLFQF